MSDLLHTFDLVEQGSKKKRWTFMLYRDFLRLTSEDGSTYVEIPKSENAEKIEWLEPLLLPTVLIIKTPKKILFKPDPAQSQAIRQWIGPLTKSHLKGALKQRLSWCFPIGILYLIASIPLPADAQTGAAAIPFDPLSAFLGAALIVSGIAMKFFPNRNLFLVDSAWFLVLALQNGYAIVNGASIFWAILLIIQLSLVRSGWRLYQRFSPSNQPVAAAPLYF